MRDNTEIWIGIRKVMKLYKTHSGILFFAIFPRKKGGRMKFLTGGSSKIHKLAAKGERKCETG